MKPPRNLCNEAPNNAADLIAHLRKLYEAMNSDPAFAASAEHIRSAFLELEKTRRLAWEVYREEKAAQEAEQPRRSKKRAKKAAENLTDWLRNATPASPLKQ